MLGSVIFNRLPHSFSTQRRLNKKTLCYGLYLHANIAHTKFERVLNDTDRVLLRNVSLAIWPASCSSQLIKVGVIKQLPTNRGPAYGIYFGYFRLAAATFEGSNVQ